MHNRIPSIRRRVALVALGLAFTLTSTTVIADPSADLTPPSATLTAPDVSSKPASDSSDSGHHYRHRSRHHHGRESRRGREADQSSNQAVDSSQPSTDVQASPSPPLQAASGVHSVPATHQKAAATAPVSVDSMTRDGSQAAVQARAASDSADTASMDVTASIFRMVLSLLLVLAIIGGAIFTLRKRGFGVGNPAPTASQAEVKPQVQFGVNPWAAMLAQQVAASKQAVPLVPQVSSVAISPISDLDIVGSRPLPGTSVTLYKIRSGDRLLLIGASQNGSVTLLSEWDLEMKPETERRFDEILDRESVLVGAVAPESDALRDLSTRLGQTAQRLSLIGNRASGRDDNS